MRSGTEAARGNKATKVRHMLWQNRSLKRKRARPQKNVARHKAARHIAHRSTGASGSRNCIFCTSVPSFSKSICKPPLPRRNRHHAKSPQNKSPAETLESMEKTARKKASTVERNTKNQKYANKRCTPPSPPPPAYHIRERSKTFQEHWLQEKSQPPWESALRILSPFLFKQISKNKSSKNMPNRAITEPSQRSSPPHSLLSHNFPLPTTLSPNKGA